MQDYNYIQIGKTGQSLAHKLWVAAWFVKNVIERSASVPQALDGTLHYENIDEWIRPEIDFMLNFLSPDDYADAVQILSLGTFVCRYYNPAIKKWCRGLFKLTDDSLAQFIKSSGNNLIGIQNYKFKAKSIYTYDDFEDLSKKAENDERF